MPRKQNGFGSFANSGFKGVNSNVKSGKGSSALGRYPSERKFGSTVQRSVIEQYNETAPGLDGVRAWSTTSRVHTWSS